MGMFTEVRHPVDGRLLQIMGGGDACEVLSVGDPVGFHIDPEYPGVGDFLDGYYGSYSDRGKDAYVIVKDHKIHAVVDLADAKDVDLYARFEITPFERSWWSESVWLARDLDRASADLEEARARHDFLSSLEGLSDAEIKERREAHKHNQLIASVSRLIGTRLNYQSIGRKLFTVEPLPAGAPLIYMQNEEEKKNDDETA